MRLEMEARDSITLISEHKHLNLLVSFGDQCSRSVSKMAEGFHAVL